MQCLKVGDKMEENNLADEELRLQERAQELQTAIITVLFSQNDPSQLRMANAWMTSFLASPLAWSVSLYLAFPPPVSNLGLQQEVRFFSLNLLLSKIRTDWLQLTPKDAREIYDVLIRQLPFNRHDKIVRARLCVVLGAAAALAGADTCYELIETAVGESEVELELALKIDVLTALAEETLHRTHGLSWEVKHCMQECCPQVLIFLNTVVESCEQIDILGNFFTCLERWIPTGVTLSELFSGYPLLFSSLLGALGSSNEACFQPAVWALLELVSQVDILPGRESAICALIKAVLAQKWQYDAAATTPGINDAGLFVRAHGLCSLVSELGSVEGALLARSGIDGAHVLEWLVDASRGGGGLGLEGALMANGVWPRLAAIPRSKRGDFLNESLFGAAIQAIFLTAKYPPEFESWDILELEEEHFNRFRGNIADGALIAIFKELNSAFLSLVLEMLNGAMSWQDAEVSLFAAASVSKEVIAISKRQNQDEIPEILFLKGICTWLFGAATARGNINRQNTVFLETSVLMLERYAEWIGSQASLMEHAIQYVITTLSINEVRVKAAFSLKELCYAAAPSLAATWPVELLIGSCEAALSVPTQLSREQENQVRTSVVQGLAFVAAALPITNAEIALTRLTFGAISTIKELATAQGGKDQVVAALESALKVVSAAVECESVDDGRMHPAVHLLKDIWSVLESLAVTWAADAAVAAALCDLWGIVACKVGISFVQVLPGIIVAASSMFKLHQVAAPLLCLSKVVRLASVRPTPELEKCLTAMLLEVTSVLGDLDKVMDGIEQSLNIASSTSDCQHNGDGHETDLEGSLCMMYELGRSFLQYYPAVLLPSAALMHIFASATGSIRRKHPDVALAAANFLSDAILGPSSGDGMKKEQRNWNLPPDLLSYVDRVVGYYGMVIVEAVLRRLALSNTVESLKEALVDVLYGLCVCYSAATEGALISTMNAPDFPGKLGFSTDSDKKLFLAALFRQPPHPRIRFQDIMRVFSGVCQTLSSAEALQQF